MARWSKRNDAYTTVGSQRIASFRSGVCGVNAGTLSQRYRRQDIEQMDTNGGRACDGIFQETDPCDQPAVAVVPSALTSWSQRGGCSLTCDSGVHSRKRSVETSASNGGPACIGAFEVLETCNAMTCVSQEVKCDVSQWTKRKLWP